MTTLATPRWTRYAAPAAALWYAFGLSQAIIGYIADAAAAPMPIWAAYFAACLAGMAGSVALFFAPRRAFAFLALSLASAVLYFGWLFLSGGASGEDYGIGAMVVGVTLVLTMLARRV